jgi:3alpha(or 20beta)-hydroxysteroid dehydrogenase
MNRLDNKVVLITGGARGQGAAEAELFIEAGATVVITDIDENEGAGVARQLGAKCSFYPQDVTDEAQWQGIINQVVEEHGRLDVLVNNAGLFRVAAMQDTSLELWNQLIAVNQTSVFLGMRAVAPVMTEQKSGSIINLSSIAGLAGTPRAPAYSATKWAVRGMTKSAALELAPHGIRVNSVHPGLIDTRMMNQLEETSDELDARVPLGQQGTADEIARLVLFLASDDSSHCSGHEFVADGAMKA